jgi:hypothetical protein
MTRCQICNEPGAAFCSNFVVCNERARLQLGIPAWQVRLEKARDEFRYPRRHGGRR